MSQHSDRARNLQQVIRKMLIKDWDPIGVSDIPEALDEYDAYVPEIYKMIISRAPRHKMFEYLWWLETEHMGLIGDRQQTDLFAERLCAIHEGRA